MTNLMTPEQQRIAISEYVGNKIRAEHEFDGKDENRYFECIYCGAYQSWSDYNKSKQHPDGPCANTKFDYSEDLNAICDAVRVFTQEQLRAYGEHLTKIVASPHGNGFHLYVKYPWTGDDVAALAFATAQQRSEAFLKTIGKWPSVQLPVDPSLPGGG